MPFSVRIGRDLLDDDGRRAFVIADVVAERTEFDGSVAGGFEGTVVWDPQGSGFTNINSVCRPWWPGTVSIRCTWG
jgi:hypothetical protein